MFSFRLLKNAKEGVSHGGLGLLAKHRKRERLRTLLEILRALKTLVCHVHCTYMSYFLRNYE